MAANNPAQIDPVAKIALPSGDFRPFIVWVFIPRRRVNVVRGSGNVLPDRQECGAGWSVYRLI
jgi:hypothetical protein